MTLRKHPSTITLAIGMVLLASAAGASGAMNGLSANGWAPNGLSANGWAPNGLSANGWGPNGLSANGIASRTARVRAVILQDGSSVVLN